MPYPYVAAMAICSDIDETESIDEFLDIQEFLNTNRQTVYGPGLGLEIGNSFWFYNQFTQLEKSGKTDSVVFSGGDDRGISIFSGTSDTLNEYSDVLIALIKAGYLDCLHSYGHFAEGGFSRALAKQALALMTKDSLRVETFVDHGGPENQNNMGDAPSFMGDDRGKPAYHADLTMKAGFRFLWRGQLTHCIGQDGSFSLLNTLKRWYESFQDWRNKGQDFHNDNKLVHEYTLDDGQVIFDFVRYNNPWGKYATASEPNIIHQIGPDVIDELIKNHGFMIFYTHFGINPLDNGLSDSTVMALRYIADNAADSELLVATTTHLLNYYVNTHNLYWHTEEHNDTLDIMIDSIADAVDGSFVPTTPELQGLTFYVPDYTNLSLLIGRTPVASRVNPVDRSGRRSISIPWIPLTYPTEVLNPVEK
jgi:hypothetical protein